MWDGCSMSHWHLQADDLHMPAFSRLPTAGMQCWTVEQVTRRVVHSACSYISTEIIPTRILVAARYLGERKKMGRAQGPVHQCVHRVLTVRPAYMRVSVSGRVCPDLCLSSLGPRIVRRRLLCSSPILDEDVVAASGMLSVRERLRREPLDRTVLELISELGLGRPKRGDRRRQGHAETTTPSVNVLARMGFCHAAHTVRNLPAPALSEIAFAGRSNVGKSSLLNALAGSRGTMGVAAVANRPGVTRSINFYQNPSGAQLVDLPGYGFAFASESEVARWQAAMRGYLASGGRPLRVMLVIDARQSLKQSDRDFLLWLDRDVSVPLHVTMSKCDMVPAAELARRYTMLGAELRALQLHHHVPPHHMVSSKTGGGIDLLRASLAVQLPQRVLAAAARHAAREGTAGAGATTTAAADLAVEVATPAAQRFAEQVAARRVKAKAAHERQAEPLERNRTAVARDFFLQRQAARRSRGRQQR